MQRSSCYGFGVHNVYQEEKWFCLTVRVYLTVDLSTLQERAQRLCQEIEKQVKSGKTIPEGKVPACKITEVKTKLVEVMRIMLDNRLVFNEECFSQCGKCMQERVSCFGITVFNSVLSYNVAVKKIK